MWTSETRIALAVGLPGAVVAAAALVVALAGAAGQHWLWSAEPLTLSEAAALRDLGEIARLVESGADPNEPSTVRPGVLPDHAGAILPLDAALAARRVDSFSILLEVGADVAPAEWRSLRCRAEAVNSPDIVELLLHLQPRLAAGACPPP